ncbi:DDE-type integrase/transposase/recombinase [Microvirga sp. TS319]|uniref:DDE-type integrase/transposase/recombinase n=1 Tax=Microvirga sp. TS319 TaxID=3241165 RepID=UPI00351A9845
MITDKLASYGAARREMGLSIEHRQHRGSNNRAENSHQPTRRRERQMKPSSQRDRRSASSRSTIRSAICFTCDAIG